jgi:hypothetical protein
MTTLAAWIIAGIYKDNEKKHEINEKKHEINEIINQKMHEVAAWKAEANFMASKVG